MKPYGRIRKIKGTDRPWKRDNHPRPKNKVKNWWENDFDTFRTRSFIKQLLQKMIKKEIE